MTFLREDELPEVIVEPRRCTPHPRRRRRPAGRSAIAKMDVRLDGARLKLFEVPEGQNGPGVVRGCDRRSL